MPSRSRDRGVRRRVTTVLLLLSLAPTLASARQPAAPTAAEDRLRQAEAMATEAKALFQNKVYVDAARLFLEAFAISKRATLVYNAARAYEEAGRLKRAESLFMLYRSLPDADAAGRSDAEAHLQEVRRRIAAGEGSDEPDPADPVAPAPPSQPTEPAPQPPPTVQQPTRTPLSGWRFWAGVGGGALAAGLYGGALYLASGLDLGAVRDDASRKDYAATRDRAVFLRWAAVGVGVAAAGMMAWTALRDVGPDAGQAAVVPLIGPGHAGLAVSF